MSTFDINPSHTPLTQARTLPLMATSTTPRKILIVSYAGQGLINPSLRLANRLLELGVAVTIATSIRVVKCIDKQTTHPTLTFAPFSDGHDDHTIGKKPTATLQQHISDFARNGALAVADIITSAAAKGEPFDHLVYTTIIPWAADVAAAHGVKSTLLWCQPASVLTIYYRFLNGFEELISANKNNPNFPVNLPGLPPLTMADLPSFFLSSSPKEHEFLVPIYKGHIDAIKTAPKILVNSFSELEIHSMQNSKEKSSGCTRDLPFVPIGPLTEKDSYGSPNHDCITWLNTKPKKSVVYISFGSLCRLSRDQAEEIATGLVESRRPFLWVIRDENESAKLSKIEELKTQGMIVSWCCQVEVLSHQAIGCMVMHCGWNSTVEALAAGVPVVAYPQWTDQTTIAKMIESVWKVGVRVVREGDGVVKGKEVVRCVEMVMGDDEIGRNVLKWKELATEAVSNGGSSARNLQAFVADVSD